MIEVLNGRQMLGEFNKSQIMSIFQGFKYNIMNGIVGERGGWVRRVM